MPYKLTKKEDFWILLKGMFMCELGMFVVLVSVYIDETTTTFLLWPLTFILFMGGGMFAVVGAMGCLLQTGFLLGLERAGSPEED